jgi:hypothetical protein
MPPRRLRLSYLLTAWTTRPEDEHRLLSALLAALLRHDVVPTAHLRGALADQPIPVLLQLALPAGSERGIADVWNALGGELKPSLDLVVVAPFDPARVESAAPLVAAQPELRVRPSAIDPGLAAADTPAASGAQATPDDPDAPAAEPGAESDEGPDPRRSGPGHGPGPGSGPRSGSRPGGGPVVRRGGPLPPRGRVQEI